MIINYDPSFRSCFVKKRSKTTVESKHDQNRIITFKIIMDKFDNLMSLDGIYVVLVIDELYSRLIKRYYAQNDPEQVIPTADLRNILGHDNCEDRPTKILARDSLRKKLGGRGPGLESARTYQPRNLPHSTKHPTVLQKRQTAIH